MSMSGTFDDENPYPTLVSGFGFDRPRDTFTARFGGTDWSAQLPPRDPETTAFLQSPVGIAREHYKPKTWRDIEKEQAARDYQPTDDLGRPLHMPSVRAIGSALAPHTAGDVALWFTPGGAAMKAGIAANTLLNSTDTAQAGISTAAAKAMRRARAAKLRGEEPEVSNWRLGEIADDARYGIGGNNPPPEFSMTPQNVLPAPSAPQTPLQAYNAWQRDLPRPQPAARSTELPDLRTLPVDQAVEIARRQPHLIVGGEGTAGRYVGGPRDVQSKAQLNKIRRDFDQFVAQDPRGWDWYDRYRAGHVETTGNTPRANEWASKLNAQFSAGVDPGSELQFSLKELNSLIAGMPVKAARPAQHEAFQRAAAANDPNLLQLGEKTGEYATKTNPDQLLPPGATGVNDFRHLRNFGYTEVSGEAQEGSIGKAGHSFLDYETALAVDRANKAKVGGRENWTGEQLQAAPWVRQKAEDLMSRNPNLTYEDAMVRALRTITDYFPKHTYFATYEAQPARGIGHMDKAEAAPYSEKVEFERDPRSNWAFAPGGRDAIYGNFNVAGTGSPGDPGLAMRVRPTIPMQGIYTVPGSGVTEFNPGRVARPLGAFDVGATKDDPFKTTPRAEIALLNAGEAVRGYVDAQNASTWSKLWTGGPNKQMGSLFFERSGPATQAELLQARALGAQHGLPDAYDTGRGIVLTDFSSTPQGGPAFDKAIKQGTFGQLGMPTRVRVEGGYVGREDALQKPGQGEATRQMLEYVNRTPEIRDALNRNADIAKAAGDRMARDIDWAARWGAPREDIQRAREIIAQGPGWVDRLEAALKAGVVLPATVAAIFAAAREGGDRGQL